MKNISNLKWILAIIVIAPLLSCIKKTAFKNPVGYDLSKPVKYNMPGDLSEISGIAFSKGKSDMIYTETDEVGKVFYLKPGDKTAKFTSFKDSGDFEDIAICGQQVVMLQSKGVLFTIPLSEIGKPATTKAQKWNGLLPEGEYEGMTADEQAGQVYVLCKHCNMDKTSKACSGFIFNVSADGTVKQAGDFRINVKHIESLLGKDKISFHPSALAKSPLSHDWYILSSVNKILVVADEKWKIREVYPLNPDLFTQPEGIAFDSQNNLYISNEGHVPVPGNILKFPYKKPAN